MNLKGEAATFTGPKATEWAGGKQGKYCAAQGNILAGPAVVDNMIKAFEETKGHLSLRFMAALEAGQAAGGDKRGMQSASMVIVKKGAGVWLNNDTVLRFQVDDQENPYKELRRVVENWNKSSKQEPVKRGAVVIARTLIAIGVLLSAIECCRPRAATHTCNSLRMYRTDPAPATVSMTRLSPDAINAGVRRCVPDDTSVEPMCRRADVLAGAMLHLDAAEQVLGPNSEAALRQIRAGQRLLLGPAGLDGGHPSARDNVVFARRWYALAARLLLAHGPWRRRQRPSSPRAGPGTKKRPSSLSSWA